MEVIILITRNDILKLISFAFISGFDFALTLVATDFLVQVGTFIGGFLSLTFLLWKINKITWVEEESK